MHFCLQHFPPFCTFLWWNMVLPFARSVSAFRHLGIGISACDTSGPNGPNLKDKLRMGVHILRPINLCVNPSSSASVTWPSRSAQIMLARSLHPGKGLSTPGGLPQLRLLIPIFSLGHYRLLFSCFAEAMLDEVTKLDHLYSSIRPLFNDSLSCIPLYEDVCSLGLRFLCLSFPTYILVQIGLQQNWHRAPPITAIAI